MTVKIIGKFQEVDGEEYNAIGELIQDKGLIGSTSADVGNVELYYDNKGNTYAVAHNSEEYFGTKERQGVETNLVKDASTINLLAFIVVAGLVVYGVNKHRDSRRITRSYIDI